MSWVTEARIQVNKALSKYPQIFIVVAKETAVDLLCKELEKIPVPFVGTILSKLLKQALKSKDKAGRSIEDVLKLLQQMKLSDHNFIQGLSEIGEDIDRLETIIASTKNDIEITRKQLTEPKLAIRDPEYKNNYPYSDNELYFSLMNVGAGALKVPEISLFVEKWEPEIKVNYTAIAAPPIILRLKIKLSVGIQLYPLLKLNNEPYRRFGAYSEGAEDVCIQMSSEKNARYYVRIRIPYKDLATEQGGELLYPSADKPALVVSFPYAPGWGRRVTPDNMLERGKVLTEITNTFTKAKSILEEMGPSDDAAYLESIDQGIRETGFSMGLAYIPYVLNQFIPPVAEMIKEEKQTNALKVLFELAHQTMRHCRRPGQFDEGAINSLCNLFDKPEARNLVCSLFTQQDEESRQKILTEIFKAIRR